MEREAARVQVMIPESQEQLIFPNMQYNHSSASDRRRLSLENIPGVYQMSCTELLALASSSSVADSQMSMDSWANSWKMASTPLILNHHGSSLESNTDISRAPTMQKPQYDSSAPPKFFCDLNLTPEEIMDDIQPTTPRKRSFETNEEPRVHVEPEPPVVEKRKRGREEMNQVKTPKQIQKRKKIRPKVVREDGKTTKRAAPKPRKKKATAVAAGSTVVAEVKSSVRPKRSCRRSLWFVDDDLEEDDDAYYYRFTSPSPSSSGFQTDSSSGGEESANPTMEIFRNIPKRKRSRITSSAQETTNIDQTVSSIQSDSQISQCLGNVTNCNKLGRKSSNILTQPRNFRSLKRVLEGKGSERPPELKAIVTSEMQSVVSRKKRSQRDPIASQLNSRVLQLQWRRKNPKGRCSEELWQQKFAIDSITEMFEKINLNKHYLDVPHNRETALILHQKTCQELKASVPYRTNGSIVPYPIEQKHLPKVDLDEETSRVWKLLMVSVESEGIDGSDDEKKKWWEEERNVFYGRASSFISRMRLVQGDRRFSPWKGSVVDSVIGVFLTQNVADHTSSSAFMDIAAEFPVDWNFNNNISYHEEWQSSVTQETNAFATPRLRNQPCIIIQEIDNDDDTDAVCSQETSRISDRRYSPSQSLPLPQYLETTLDVEVGSSSSSTSCELNLNEVPLEVEKYDDADRSKVDESSQVLSLISQDQELKNAIQVQRKDPQSSSNTKNMKKPTKKNQKKPKTAKPAPKKKTESFDWDSLREQTESGGKKRERTERNMDTVDWDALRCTHVKKIADLIRKRGMNNMLSQRIKDFLNRMFRDHGSIDLEWLRDVHPDKAKEYLLSINGLGLKSVECVRLLSLHQVAFPVDTNVGRIAVRLGWVPLQPLPDELQMHLLELYPVLASVQKYLWPRLCKLDQETLYELHYHMITFGKVFCTKKNPNCNACPLKAECRHYASASGRLALPGPEDRSTVIIHERRSNPKVNFKPSSLFLTQETETEKTQNNEPIIELPASPEPEYTVTDIEDYPGTCTIFETGSSSKDPWENNDEIQTIMLHKEAGISTDLVVLNPEAARRPRQKLKIKEKLRTEHYVYELPDSHPILEGFEKRELGDIFPYLLAIWSPGETANSIHPPKRRCVFQGSNRLCHDKTCFSCNTIREEESQIVRGTILIPCRTAMRGGFPLNGTYFQVNEVFADHSSSINPIDVPRQWIWNLPRRIAYFGSSVTASFRGLSVEAIQYGFWRGYVCVRGFDRKSRKPKPLVKRLHCPPSNKNQEDEED